MGRKRLCSAVVFSLVLLIALFFLGRAVTPVAFALSKDRIVIGFGALEFNNYPGALAAQLGLYQKYGIQEVELIYLDGGPRTLQALLTGDIDVAITGGTNVVAAHLGNIPAVQIVSYSDRMSDDIVARPEIRTAEDLKGKAVAVSQLGGESHAAVILALRQLGLDPDRDVVISQIGGQSARLAALRAGSVAAAPIDPALRNVTVDELGMNVLVALADSPARIQRAGITILPRFAEQHPDTTEAIVKANLEAIAYLIQEREGSIELAAQWMRVDREEAAQAYDAFRDFFIPDGIPDPRATEAAIDIVARQDPRALRLNPKNMYDLAWTVRLWKSGFTDSLYR